MRNGQIIIIEGNLNIHSQNNTSYYCYRMWDNSEWKKFNGSLIESNWYLVNVSRNKVEFQFFIDKSSHKINGIEMNQYAPNFSVPEWQENVKILMKQNPQICYGLEGSIGTYVYRIRPNDLENLDIWIPMQFFRSINGKHQFFCEWHTIEDLITLNEALLPILRNLSIDKILE